MTPTASEEPLSQRSPDARGLFVSVRPAAVDDLDFAHAISIDFGVGHWTGWRGDTVRPETFHASAADQTVANLIVTDRRTGRRISFITCHSPDVRNGHAHLSVVSDPSLLHSGLGADALTTALHFLFERFQFRKLYWYVPSPVLNSIASGDGSLFTVEGRLVADRYIDGARVDTAIVAFYADVVLARRAPGTRSSPARREAGR